MVANGLTIHDKKRWIKRKKLASLLLPNAGNQEPLRAFERFEGEMVGQPMKTNVSNQGHKILIADDDDAIHICMEEIAAQEGWEACFAKNGWECMEKINEFMPNLVIVDQRMPWKTGIEIIQNLRQSKIEIPVILISSEKNLPISKISSNMFHFLEKPLVIPKLLHAVNHMLRSNAEVAV